MGKRLLLGIFKGLVIGVGFALVAIKLLGLPLLSGFLGYACAAATGLLVGLIAGRPVWARDAKVEASLKALVGAVAAAAVMFVLQRWVGMTVNLEAVGFGNGKLSQLAITALPTIAVALGLLFELDDAVGGAAKASQASQNAKLRAPEEASADLDEGLENELDDAESNARRSQKH